MAASIVRFVLVTALLGAAVHLSNAARMPGELQQIVAQGTQKGRLDAPERTAGLTRRHHHDDDDDVGEGTECDEPDYRKTSLRLIKEAPIIGLFRNTSGIKKFEASGMEQAHGKLWIVFDNLQQLGRIDEHFEFRGDDNKLIGEDGDDSQFEGLTYVKSTGHFLALEESFDSEEHGLVPCTQEMELAPGDKSYKIIRRCPVHFKLTHGNKGFEGLHYHEDAHGHKFIMGLCEGNHCTGGKEGREKGNGRIVVAEFYENGDKCGWNVKKIVHVPREAYFGDYSGMAFRGSKIAVISQEAAAMYVSHFDFEELEFVTSDDDQIYTLPRNALCEVMYCNIEGVQWLDDDRLVMASDKAKADQPYPCTLKDQSVHIFALPS